MKGLYRRRDGDIFRFSPLSHAKHLLCMTVHDLPCNDAYSLDRAAFVLFWLRHGLGKFREV